MKRILAITMALAMLVGAMTISAGATYKDDAKHLTADNAGNTGNYGVVSDSYSASDTIGESTVPVKFDNGVSGSITNVYAVSFTPSELSFTYGGGARYIWNPEDQEYETVTPGGDTWTPVTNVITITNYSDLAVEIEAKFEKDTGITEEVAATFTDSDTSTGDSKLSLASAVATNSLGATGNPTSGTFTVTFEGALNTLYPNGTKLGDITLTLKVPQG